MQDTKPPTRAELLERCQAAGLKATGWKKERMAEELERLEHLDRVSMKPEDAALIVAQVEAAAGAEQGEDQPVEQTGEPEAVQPPAPPARKTGWCSFAPAWGRAHLDCPAGRKPGFKGDCSCECHGESWTRPEIPEGAQLSKFNHEDRRALGLPVYDYRPAKPEAPSQTDAPAAARLDMIKPMSPVAEQED